MPDTPHCDDDPVAFELVASFSNDFNFLKFIFDRSHCLINQLAPV